MGTPRDDALEPSPGIDPEAGLDPTNWPALRRSAHAMLDDALDHIETIGANPLWREPPTALRAARRSGLPRRGAGLDAAHEIFRREILPYPGGNAHPGFMGWVQGAGSPAGMLAEMLAAAMNANCGGRDHMAIEVEREVLGWTRTIFDFPRDADGLFVSGASQANFIGVLAALTRTLGPEVRRGGLRHAPTLVAYAGAGVHGCIVRALEMSGLGSDALRRIGADGAGRIDVAALRRGIAEDRRLGRQPFLIVGTAGSVDTGAIDDLDALADVAAEESVSLHVDGALGALGALSPRLKPLLHGIERADSLAFDWHKWGHAPYDAGFILVRDRGALRRTFAAPAAYLARSDRGLAAGEDWPCDKGPELSRGFRALKVWFTLKTYGADAFGAAMERNCVLAQTLADEVRRTPELILLAPVALNIVCFAYRGPDADRLNARIVADLHEAGRVAPSLTRVGGRAAIRAAIVNHRTSMSDVEALIAGVLAAGRAADRYGAAA